MCDRFYHCDKKYHATNKLFDEKSRNFIHLKHIAMDIGRKVKDVLLAKGITVRNLPRESAVAERMLIAFWPEAIWIRI